MEVSPTLWLKSKSGYNFTFMIASFFDNDDVKEPLENSFPS
jgi:hypothetical protein